MDIIVNGQKVTLPSSVTNVTGLLSHLALKKEFVIVEQNGVILAKEAWNEKQIFAGDKLEIVQFVGGG